MQADERVQAIFRECFRAGRRVLAGEGLDRRARAHTDLALGHSAYEDQLDLVGLGRRNRVRA